MTSESRINAAKKDRSMGMRCNAGIRESTARTGSTTGFVIWESTTITVLSSITNHERIACPNMAK